MMKIKKLAKIFMIIGLYLPLVLYPFATPDSNAKAIQFAVATKGIIYEPKLNQLEVVLVSGEIKNKSKLSFKKEGHIAIPYRWLYAFGVSLFFIGLTFRSIKCGKEN